MTQQTERLTNTAPAQPKGLGGLKWRARGMASACMLPLMQRAARAYVGGESLGDALAVARRMANERLPTTLGFWNADEVQPRQVADDYLTAIEQITAAEIDGYLSIKPPALGFDGALATELAAVASTQGVRLHCDSHGVETADPSIAMMQTMLEVLDASHLSTTIPGRWTRSLADADWAVEHGVKVRVVKGQWPDPAEPDRDMARGFLEVIDRLAGRARHVAVASHDVALAAEAIARLRAAGTSCELELLFGLPMTRSVDWAREHGVGTRIYVPYGKGYIPHAIDQLWRNPRFVWWILKDLITIRPAASRPKPR
jgi:proline dehydrogenase